MKKTVAITFLIIIIFGAAVVNAAEIGLSLGFGCMSWKEYLANSRRDPFTEEYGIFYSAGVSISFFPSKNISSRLELEGFNGQMNYRGVHLIDNTLNDARSTWQGFSLEETLSYKIKVGKDFYFSLSASLAISAWSREESAENWHAGYGRLGIRISKGVFFAKLGVLKPIYTELQSGFKDLPWLNNGQETKFELNPKGVATPFAEIGLKHKKITISFSYEMRKWEESDRVTFKGGGYVFQPETNQNLVSLRVEYFF